jgi:DNA-binding PadR family transcriptional regulator
VIKFLLLGLLVGRPRHGYELKTAFEELFGGTWPLNPGQVYMTLSKLEDEGLVTSEVVEQELLPDRRMYGITEDGRGELKRWTSEAADGPIRIRDEMVTKVLTAMAADNSENRGTLDLIWAQRRNHLQAIAQLRDRKNDEHMTPATKLVLEGAILRAEADLRWLDLVEEQIREGAKEEGT